MSGLILLSVFKCNRSVNEPDSFFKFSKLIWNSSPFFSMTNLTSTPFSSFELIILKGYSFPGTTLICFVRLSPAFP